MSKKKERILSIALFVTILLVVVFLTTTGIFALLYVMEKNEKSTIETSLVTANEKATTMESENVELEEAIATLNEQDQQLKEQLDEQVTESDTQDPHQELLAKALARLTADDGNPLKALRDLFPENFIYYDSDEKSYCAAPVLDEVPKHNLVSENFVETQDGQMQYVENGEVTSHKGIDVSKYQGTIDWNKVKADGVEYAFIRLGLRGYESGKNVLDEYYEDNISKANKAGVPVGVYFFTQAITVEEAKEEAQFVLENIEGYDVSCPIVFDVEMVGSSSARANSLSKQDRTDITIAFCEAIKEAGYIPMIYGNVKCFTKLLDLTQLLDYERWYAFYDDYMYMPYDVSCWQYSEKGTVSGIKEKVDLNISYKLW
jgi:GH25 family lysozyme M1 (1,4-beta-N-acetylmuramidase)